MPAARLTKASISNAIVRSKEHGLTPRACGSTPTGSFSIDAPPSHANVSAYRKVSKKNSGALGTMKYRFPGLLEDKTARQARSAARVRAEGRVQEESLSPETGHARVRRPLRVPRQTRREARKTR